MADEITMTMQLSVSKDGLSLQYTRNGIRADLAGDGYSAAVQDIGFAAHEAVAIHADIATAGVALFRNADDTNFVEIGRDVTGAFVSLLKLLPGESQLVRLSTTAVYAKADTASVPLEFVILEA